MNNISDIKKVTYISYQGPFTQYFTGIPYSQSIIASEVKILDDNDLRIALNGNRYYGDDLKRNDSGSGKLTTL